MSAPQIVRSENFDISKLEFSEPKKLGHGGNAVYVNYEGSPLILQTPTMTLPWSMGKFEKAGEETKYSIDLSFKGMDGDSKMESFYSVLSGLDDRMVKDGVRNSMSWFKKKKLSEDVVSAFYSPLLKVSKDRETGEPDGKYPPVMKVKLPYRDGKFGFDAYDTKKCRIEGDMEEVLVKKCEVKCLIQCVGIWFAGGKYGLSWKVMQMKVSPPAGLHGYSIQDDSEDEVEEGGEEMLEEEDDVIEDDELEEEEED